MTCRLVHVSGIEQLYCPTCLSDLQLSLPVQAKMVVEFAEDPQLLNLSLSPAQRTLLKSFYGEPLTDAEAAIFRQCAERDYEPYEYCELT